MRNTWNDKNTLRLKEGQRKFTPRSGKPSEGYVPKEDILLSIRYADTDSFEVIRRIVNGVGAKLRQEAEKVTEKYPGTDSWTYGAGNWGFYHNEKFYGIAFPYVQVLLEDPKRPGRRRHYSKEDFKKIKEEILENIEPLIFELEPEDIEKCRSPRYTDTYNIFFGLKGEERIEEAREYLKELLNSGEPFEDYALSVH